MECSFLYLEIPYPGAHMEGTDVDHIIPDKNSATFAAGICAARCPACRRFAERSKFRSSIIYPFQSTPLELDDSKCAREKSFILKNRISTISQNTSSTVSKRLSLTTIVKSCVFRLRKRMRALLARAFIFYKPNL